MAFNIVKLISLLSTVLAIIALGYLRAVYTSESKTKQMSKTAYVLLVAFLLQTVSLLTLTIFSFKNSEFLVGTLLFLSVLSPYVLGRIIKDFEKVNLFIYLQIFIFILDIFLICF